VIELEVEDVILRDLTDEERERMHDEASAVLAGAEAQGDEPVVVSRFSMSRRWWIRSG